MISIVQQGEVYEIRFRYDPFLVSTVKLIPGRQWNPDGKFWTIPRDKLGFLLNQLKGTKYEDLTVIKSEEHINENRELESTTVIPDVDVSDWKFLIKKGCKPFKHQIEFMQYAVDRYQRGYRSGFILGDEMGAGKTVETMNLALYEKRRLKYKHCLIICCINTSKYNWSAEIHDNTRGRLEGYILGTRLKKDGSRRKHIGGKEKLADLETGKMYGDTNGKDLPYFLITNIESIRMKSGRTYPIADRIIEMCNSGELSMIAIDEIHKNASPTSIQGKQLLRIKKYTGRSVEWIPITGTPIVNKPTDVYLPLKLIDGHNYSSYYSWCREFCIYGGYGNHEIIGYKNIPMLKAMLQSNMIRRLKKDILDLPPKLYYDEYVENTPYQDKLEEKFIQEAFDHADEIASSMNPMVKFLRLRQVNGSPELVDPDLKVDSDYINKNAKLKRLLEILEDIHDRHEKVVIFSNWVDPLRTLYKFIKLKYKVCCYTGTMPEDERQKHKRVFIENPEYTVMIGTIGALGTTHTLTVAKNVIFYDEPWTYTDKIQAEDRTHRPGTTSPVNIYTLLSKDTIDDRVHDIVYGKGAVSGYIVDNQLDFRNNPDLVYKLLGKYPTK